MREARNKICVNTGIIGKERIGSPLIDQLYVIYSIWLFRFMYICLVMAGTDTMHMIFTFLYIHQNKKWWMQGNMKK